MDSNYLTSAQKPDQLPSYEAPEVAFVGRSNSGKSTLLNTLLERKSLARTSSTPGRTQMIHFFSLHSGKEKDMIFADLPGYGYHKASSQISKYWDSLMEAYFKRSNLKYVLFLRDVRRKFDLFETDFIKLIAQHTQVVIVLTKSDKCTQKELSQLSNHALEELTKAHVAPGGVFCISSLNKKGILDLSQFIFET
jgi:GTP-binding protein